MENYSEIEEMRREIAVLKDKLARQTIISEEHIRRSMHDKVRKIKTQTVVLAVAGTAGIAFCTWALYCYVHLSLALTIATDLFLTAAIIFSLWSTRKIHPADMMGENLAEAGREIARMKKLGLTWKKFAYPLVAVWFIWVAAECVRHGLDSDLVLGFLVGCGLGLLGGLVCGYIYNKKQTAMVDGLLKQIDELGK